ncbi:hypothetical protein TNCV_4385761 [Trichonephila clavipes]|nr:hypothetical protein TNCV_4385761 [Trichonephila clavipes]
MIVLSVLSNCPAVYYQSDLGEKYTTHQAMPSEVPVDRWLTGCNSSAKHALLDSSPVSMMANPPIEGIRLQCLPGEDGHCHA